MVVLARVSEFVRLPPDYEPQVRLDFVRQEGPPGENLGSVRIAISAVPGGLQLNDLVEIEKLEPPIIRRVVG